MLDNYICIAGKNQCAIEIAKFLLKKRYKKNLLILPIKVILEKMVGNYL